MPIKPQMQSSHRGTQFKYPRTQQQPFSLFLQTLSLYDLSYQQIKQFSGQTKVLFHPFRFGWCWQKEEEMEKADWHRNHLFMGLTVWVFILWMATFTKVPLVAMGNESSFSCAVWQSCAGRCARFFTDLQQKFLNYKNLTDSSHWQLLS